MRSRNWRIIIVGFVRIVITLGFYFFMLSIAMQSTDPAALMQTLGTVTGAAVCVSLVMIIIGLIGKRFDRNDHGNTLHIKFTTPTMRVNYAQPNL
jgi:hypothetical protein